MHDRIAHQKEHQRTSNEYHATAVPAHGFHSSSSIADSRKRISWFRSEHWATRWPLLHLKRLHAHANPPTLRAPRFAYTAPTRRIRVLGAGHAVGPCECSPYSNNFVISLFDKNNLNRKHLFTSYYRVSSSLKNHIFTSAELYIARRCSKNWTHLSKSTVQYVLLELLSKL